jgi:hypothetical protein
MNPALYLLAAVAILAFVLYSGRERFYSGFFDNSQVKKTIAVEDSSYEQQTNHMDHAPVRMGPIAGIQTPFQVNQYKAYVP